MFPSLAYASLALAVGISPPTAADSVSLSDLPQSLSQTVECMLRVSKTVPGVAGAHLGVTSSRGPYGVGPVWAHPFLDYTYSYKDGRRGDVRFEADAEGPDRKHYVFVAGLSGLTTPGTRPLDWGADRLIDLWKTDCRAKATIFYP
jgi:hypothetical protein